MRKGKLFALANQCAGHRKHCRRKEAPKAIAASVLVRHFDAGYPLALTYDPGIYGESPAAEPVEAMSADFWSEPFEILEPDQENSAALPHFEPNEPPVMERENEPGEATPPTAVAVESTPIRPSVPAPADPMPVPQPQAEAQTILGDQELLADLRAIFQSPKTYEERPRPPAPEKEVTLKPSEHAIFDKIAQNMRFANAYDLGSYAMEQRFQQFDREIDAERRAAERQHAAVPTPPVDPAPLPVETVTVPPSEEGKDLEAIRSGEGIENKVVIAPKENDEKTSEQALALTIVSESESSE